MKLTKLDKAFSLLIRTRDKWTCVLCGFYDSPPTQRIQCSHFWSRRHSSTRFDFSNCDSLCAGCHLKHESNKQGKYRTFKLKQLGKKKYEELEKRAFSICKRSKKDLEELYSKLCQQIP